MNFYFFCLIIFFNRSKLLSKQQVNEMKKILLFIVFATLVAFSVSGKYTDYRVVDGDSLESGEERIRLQGIDAPEYLQYCFDKNGDKYHCGAKSSEYLQSLVNGEIKCNHQSKDRYGRYLSECFNSGGININRQMVISGWAVAYGDEYTEEEKIAKKSKIGVWQGKFMRPELFRALNRSKDKRNKNEKR